MAARAALLLALLVVPPLMYWSSGRQVYPSYNPDSGGATGGSLLGSTLGLIAVWIATPYLAGVRARRGHRAVAVCGSVLAVHMTWFLLLDHGNRSHHEVFQIVSLASLLVWPPLLWRYLDGFDWPAGCRRWLLAFGGWGVALVVSAVLMFLPGALELWKFTDALVAHAHVAMAGTVSAFSMVLLIALDSGGTTAAALSRSRPFALWQVGLGTQVLALLPLGTIESVQPATVYRSDWIAQALYALRWAGGLAMMLASIAWLVSAVGRRHRAIRST